MDELAAVLMASAALSNSCASVIHFPDDDSTVKNSEALSYARQQLQEIARYRK